MQPYSIITQRYTHVQTRTDTYRFSVCSRMQMADSSLTASTIIWGTLGFMARTRRGIPSADSNMAFKPYWNTTAWLSKTIVHHLYVAQMASSSTEDMPCRSALTSESTATMKKVIPYTLKFGHVHFKFVNLKFIQCTILPSFITFTEFTK